jgi:hypothetical protein
MVLDLGKLAYLDLQKTGSVFLTKAFRRLAVSEELAYSQHGPPSGARAFRDTLFVLSVRRPDSYYQSLLSYGRDGKGGLFKALTGAGYQAIYDVSTTVKEFSEFLALKHVQASSPLLFPFGPTSEYGLLSQRFFKILGFTRLPGDLTFLRSPLFVLDSELPVEFVRQEHLLNDLKDLVDRWPSRFDASQWASVSAVDPLNVSYSRSKSLGLENGLMKISTDLVLADFFARVYSLPGN